MIVLRAWTPKVLQTDDSRSCNGVLVVHLSFSHAAEIALLALCTTQSRSIVIKLYCLAWKSYCLKTQICTFHLCHNSNKNIEVCTEACTNYAFVNTGHHAYLKCSAHHHLPAITKISQASLWISAGLTEWVAVLLGLIETVTFNLVMLHSLAMHVLIDITPWFKWVRCSRCGGISKYGEEYFFNYWCRVDIEMTYAYVWCR